MKNTPLRTCLAAAFILSFHVSAQLIKAFKPAQNQLNPTFRLDSTGRKSGDVITRSFYIFAPQVQRYQGTKIQFKCTLKRLAGTQKLSATFRCKLKNEQRFFQRFDVPLPKIEAPLDFNATCSVPNRPDIEHVDMMLSFRQTGNQPTIWTVDAPAFTVAPETDSKGRVINHSLGLDASASDAPLPLIRDGKPTFQIILPFEPDLIAKRAAEEISTHVRLACGHAPEITTQYLGKGPAIHIGNTQLAQKYAVEPARLMDNQILVVRVGQNIILSGGDCPSIPAYAVSGRALLPVGTLYAAYDFLERVFGCRWYWPGKLGTHVPHAQNLAIGKLYETSCPAYTTRKTFYSIAKNQRLFTPAENEVWYRRNRFGGAYGDPIGMHSFNHWPAKFSQTHPDYFAVQSDGKRRKDAQGYAGGHVCLTNPDVIREIIREKIQTFKAKPLSHYSPVMPGDGFGLHSCKCPTCVNALKPEKGSRALSSDLVWGVVKQVAMGIAQQTPGRFITCCAYDSYSTPPSFPLPPNVMVTLCHGTPPVATPFFKDRFRTLLEPWLKTGAAITCWDYWDTARRHRGTFGAPTIFPRQLKEIYLMGAGTIRGRAIELCEFDAEGKNLGTWANWMFDIQNLYVASRLLWNPEADVEEILVQYYQNLYGPAANTIRKFYDAMERRWLQHNPNWNYDSCWNETYTPDFVDDMMALLRQAVKETRGNLPYAQRAQETLNGFLPFEKASFLYRTPKTKPNNPIIQVPRTDDWSQAATIGNFCDSYNVYPQKAKTQVWLRHDTNYLYLKFKADFPAERKTIRWADTVGQRDALLWNHESVEVFLAAEGDTYYQFILAPTHALADFSFPTLKHKWNAKDITWKASHDQSNAWNAELAIPLKEIIFDQKTADGSMKINIYRNHYYMKDNQWNWEQSGWLPTFGSFHNQEHFGKLILK